MKREFGVEANVGKPQVAYRETIRKTGRRRRRQVRQAVGRPGPVRPRRAQDRAAGAGQGLRVRRRDQGRRGAARVHPGGRRRASRNAAERRAGRLPGGRRQGHADFGSYHEVDSNENAFKMAASIGFKDGCRKASPVLLEPMMAVEVETPEDYAGNVMGDLSSRRGMVQGMDDMAAAARSSRPRCRCRRCSATRPRCARCRRAARRTRWNSSTTPRRRRTSPTRSSPRATQVSHADLHALRCQWRATRCRLKPTQTSLF